MDKNNKKKKITNEDLALMIAQGFGDVDKRFEEVDKRFEEVDKRFEEVDKRFLGVDGKFENLESRLGQKIEGLSNRIDDVIYNSPNREGVTVLTKRVEILETKAGIKNK